MENLFQQNVALKSENAYQKFILYRAFTNPETLEYFFLDDSNGGLRVSIIESALIYEGIR